MAKAIVEGYHETLMADLKKPSTPLSAGMLFKVPTDGKARRAVWAGDGLLWVVSETDSYGWLGALTDPFWDLCEEFKPKRRVEVDGKGKMLEMTPEEIEEAWSNPDWKVGEKISHGQRQHIFEVIAAGPNCALLRNLSTGDLTADSNSGLSRFYQREIGVGKIEW